MSANPDHAQTATAAPCESVRWLLGQPHLADYLAFVEHNVIGGDRLARNTLVDEWRRANDHYYALEQAEAGDADRIACKPLPARLRSRAATLRASANFRNTFDVVPTTIELVELDRLVVWQTQVSDQHALGRAATLGADPDPAALFDFCLPATRPSPPVTIHRVARDHFQIASDAPDLALFAPRLLDPARYDRGDLEGPLAALLALPVGFGANLLSAIRSDSRVVLHNGYHRAFALRALGITHAPCVVQHVTRTDELNLVADSRVTANPAFFFRSARPPLLRDFFDPAIARQLLIRPLRTVLDIRISEATSWL